ncbi:6-hydroxymethylpterin diphosphokinase MptE-like protein [Halobacteriales archaeon Cl-PHB]
MNFETWEPVYESILADFGYDRAGDERARDRLAALLAGDVPVSLAERSFEGETVAVAGAGPSLEADLDRCRTADVVVAASTAADRLVEAGVAVDWAVTDLDKHPAFVADLTADGLPVAIHAHGDNVGLLEEYVPTYAVESVLPTTQAAPSGPVVNLGGFTDGDRAAFLADHLGAAHLVFPGWDFDDTEVREEKRRKLRWAERLLVWLEQRRDERFAILDGRREAVDTSALPV